MFTFFNLWFLFLRLFHRKQEGSFIIITFIFTLLEQIIQEVVQYLLLLVPMLFNRLLSNLKRSVELSIIQVSLMILSLNKIHGLHIVDLVDSVLV